MFVFKVITNEKFAIVQGKFNYNRHETIGGKW
jgi:hypothetical protein